MNITHCTLHCTTNTHTHTHLHTHISPSPPSTHHMVHVCDVRHPVHAGLLTLHSVAMLAMGVPTCMGCVLYVSCVFSMHDVCFVRMRCVYCHVYVCYCPINNLHHINPDHNNPLFLHYTHTLSLTHKHTHSLTHLLTHPHTHTTHTNTHRRSSNWLSGFDSITTCSAIEICV